MNDGMGREPSIARLQAYLRHSARRHYISVALPPFTLFFHPRQNLPYFNYAIPDDPPSGPWGDALDRLREEFAARGRRARFEYIEEYAPGLAPVLRVAGFVQEAGQQLMVCARSGFRPAPPVPGLTITPLTGQSTAMEAQDFLATQRQGFEPNDERPVTLEEGEHWLDELGGGRAFLARLDGQPAGAGLYTEPFDGLVEVAGLATLEPFRRRGIATALTAQAVRSAFERGVQFACLTAEDERAGRVYRRVGFAPAATMLAYIDRGAPPPT